MSDIISPEQDYSECVSPSRLSLCLPGTNLNMEDAGQKLRRRREQLDLRYRDVEEASLQIAEKRKSDEYAIGLSRLSEIENKGTVPSIYRIYSLCAIYRLDLLDVLEWYGVDLSQLPSDAGVINIGRTHSIEFGTDVHGSVPLPLTLDPGLDVRRTTFLSRMIQRWGRLPLLLLNGIDPRTYRYAYVGTDDWSMHPLIHPGSLLLIDETRRKVHSGGWSNEQERPVYFLEHRDGYLLGWCTLNDKTLIVQPHPSSEYPAQMFAHPEEIEVVGQVDGVAMRLEVRRRRSKT
jgi:transcriptional regulator with XRE-family HTH domain